MIESNRKSVLLITRNFPPMVGGMEKLNLRMLQGLSLQHQTVLIGPAGSSQHAPAGTRVFESPALALPVFLAFAALRTLYVALRDRPDASIAGSGLTAPFAWVAARLSGKRAIVYVHGLDLIADSRIYRSLWLPFIRRCDAVIANSANTRRLAESAGVLADRITVIHPGTDIPELDAAKAAEFRNRFGLGNCPLLLSAGRITERKGLLPFLQKAWPMVLARHPDVKLLVIGSEPEQALRRDKRSALTGIRAHLLVSGLEETVRFLGCVDDATLTAAYQAANVHVFPVLESTDDVEGFGMVAIEAAANGLPTVAFDSGGVADAVIEGKTGRLITAGDYPQMAKVLCDALYSERSDKVAECLDIAKDFSWPTFNEKIEWIIQRVEYGP